MTVEVRTVSLPAGAAAERKVAAKAPAGAAAVFAGALEQRLGGRGGKRERAPAGPGRPQQPPAVPTAVEAAPDGRGRRLDLRM